MFNISHWLENITTNLIGSENTALVTHEEAEATPSAKKLPLTVPHGVSFSNWLEIERRRLDRLADALEIQ